MEFCHSCQSFSIEDVSSLLNFFLSSLGVQVVSSQRMSLVIFLSHVPPCTILPYPALCCLSLALRSQLPSATHCVSKQSLSFKWVSFLQIPPSFLALIFQFSSTWPSVKSLLVHLIQTVCSSVQRTWYWKYWLNHKPSVITRWLALTSTATRQKQELASE